MKKIKLTKNKFAIVDDTDFKWLNSFKWCVKLVNKSGRYDAVRRDPRNGKNQFMHRFIMGLHYKDGLVVDHKNHNTLDNRRSNLRVCTQSDNMKNVTAWGNSKFLGVSIAIRGPKKYWRCTIKLNGRLTSLGYFPFNKKGEREAASRYNDSAKIHFKEFANLNII
jgi:hypothetical protein